MRISLILILALFVLLSPQMVIAEDESLDELLASLSAKSKDVQTLEAKFEQQRHTPLLKKPLESSGTILVAGGKTLWKTLKPRASFTLIEGGTLKAYYPRQKLLEVYKLDQRLGELAASPLPQMETLRERFTISRDETVAVEREQLALQLVPKEESLRQYVQSIQVVIDTRTGLAHRVQWQDEDGERTVLIFTKLKPNANISNNDMQLNLPSDVQTEYPLGEVASEGASQP